MPKMHCFYILNEFLFDSSGGNKRKVSVAIAFLGKPNVIFLDEPSNGWDPISKRYLWSVINKAKQLGLCIILTSHRYVYYQKIILKN